MRPRDLWRSGFNVKMKLLQLNCNKVYRPNRKPHVFYFPRIFILIGLCVLPMDPCVLSAAEADSHAHHTHSDEQHDHGHDHSASTSQNEQSPTTGDNKLTVLLGYCVLIILGSFVGGHLPSLIHLDHNRTQTIISLVGGLMLGIGVFHMLPHAVHEVGDINFVARWMMVGLLVMFFSPMIASKLQTAGK